MEFTKKMVWFSRTDRDTNFIGFYAHPEPIDSLIIKENLVKDFQKFLNENQVSEEIVAGSDFNGKETLYFKHKTLFPFFKMASSGTVSLAVYFYWKNIFNKCSFIFMDELDCFYYFKLSEKIFMDLKN